MSFNIYLSSCYIYCDLELYKIHRLSHLALLFCYLDRLKDLSKLHLSKYSHSFMHDLKTCNQYKNLSLYVGPIIEYLWP